MGRLTGVLLQPGDTVALIAPARAVSPEEMQPFLSWANSKGLQVKKGANLYGKVHQFSGTDKERASDLMEAWTDDAVKAIFCARGGYGSMRLLPYLDKHRIQQHFKPLIGYSDITTLHLFLGKMHMESMHGMMAIDFGRHELETSKNIESLEAALFHKTLHIALEDSTIINNKPFQGIITGGNLSLLYASLGTPEQPDTNGKILFLEDLDEYLYHLDRMMASLDRAGLLAGLNGLVIGSMTDMHDNKIPFGITASEIMSHFAHYGFPVVLDFPAGHSRKNYCFKMNAFTTFEDGYMHQDF